MDTSNILFICGGSLHRPGQDRATARIGSQDSWAFGAKVKAQETGDAAWANPGAHGQPEDLIKFGLIPEFRGPAAGRRHPGRTERGRPGPHPPGAQERVDQAVPEAVRDGQACKLRFTDSALPPSPTRGPERKSGGRGLRSILEKTMLDIMYDLPVPVKDDVQRVRDRRRGRAQERHGADPAVLSHQAETGLIPPRGALSTRSRPAIGHIHAVPAQATVRSG